MNKIAAKNKLYTVTGYFFVAAGLVVGVLWVLGNYNSNFQISSLAFLNDRIFGFLILPFWFLAGFFFNKTGDKK